MLAIGVGDQSRIYRTTDGGETWQRTFTNDDPDAFYDFLAFWPGGRYGVAMSDPVDGKFRILETRVVWLASGGGASRIFHSRDRGHTWTVSGSTIPAAPAGGVFSLAFRNPRQGLAVGGDFTKPDNGVDASAYSSDGGGTWTNGGDLSGYRSGGSWLSGAPRTALAVDPTAAT